MVSIQRYPSLLLLMSLLGIATVRASPGLRVQGMGEDEAKAAEKVKAAISFQWDIIKERGLSPARASDASFLLERSFRKRGYSKASVAWEILQATETLQLRVDLGVRQSIGAIRFTGVEGSDELDAKLLEAALIGSLKEPESLLKLPGEEQRIPYVPEQLEGGLGTIEAYAVHQGYLKATARLAETVSREDGKTMDITVAVDPGPLHQIDRVVLVGVSDEDQTLLSSELETYQEEPFNQDNVRKIQGLVLKHFQDLGFFDAEVEVTEGLLDPPPAETQVLVELTVKTGEVYTVKDTVIRGNALLSERFMKKRFHPLVGERYNPGKLQDTYRDLFQSGLFNNIEIVPERVGDGQIQLGVTVEEAKMNEVGLYGGFGSFDGYILGLLYTNRNLLDTGRSLRSRIEMNGRGVEGQIGYLNRWFLNKPDLQFNLQLFTGTRDLNGYSKWELGLRGSLTKTFSKHSSASLFGELRHTSITKNDFIDSSIGLEDYQMELVGISYSWDHLKDLETRRHGYLLEGSMDYTTSFLLGDVDFLRMNFRYSHYIKLFADTELRIGARAGIMYPLGDSDPLPVDVRFFSGGNQTVRSFHERKLGSQDIRNHPLGGEFFSVYNVEYLIPITDAFRFALFADAGNVLADAGDAGLGEMHYAIGAGLLYDLPVGPLRIDYGWNANRRSGEPRGTLHLAFGFAF